MMRISILGSLRPHPHEPQWLESEPIAIPFLNGLHLPVEVLELTDSDEEDANQAINAFVKMTETDRDLVARYLCRNHQNHMADQPFQPGIMFKDVSFSTIWSHIRFYCILMSRRTVDGLIYLELLGDCDWDLKHGLQIVFKQGNILVRVSPQDGHLTHADAFNLPGLDLISEPSREEMRMIVDRKRRYPGND